MSIYTELDQNIKLCASNEAEYQHFHELVTQYFEGTRTFYELPESVRLAVAEWENQQIEQG